MMDLQALFQRSDHPRYIQILRKSPVPSSVK
jgi:hypothetical protein